MAKKTPRRPIQKPADPGSHLLDDGTITVKIKDGPHAGKSFTLDLMIAKVTCEAVEAKHKVGQAGFTVTPALLVDLAAAFCAMPGVPACTGTMAFKLWQLVNESYIDLKKGMGSTLS